MSTPKAVRVAVFSPEFPPHIMGGLGTHVGCMTGELRRYARLELLVPARGGYGQAPPGISINEIPCAPASRYAEFWLRFCRAASEASEALEFDVIQCHDWMTVLAGVSAAGRTQKPLVYNVHLPQRHPPNRAIEDIGLIEADAVIVNSRAVEAELRARRLPIRRIEVIPNGVDLRVYRPPARSARSASILFVGRLTPQKGVDVLLRAFAVVLRKRPTVRLVVAGDGELQLPLERLARQLGFPHRVSFVNWQIGSSLLGLYRRARAVVVPSYYEPFGIVALEAMACACPVIASRIGGLEEIVEDGKQGYLVPSGDHLALAGRIMDLLTDPQRREAMGAAARLRACRFSWAAAAVRTADVFGHVKWTPPTAAARAATRRALARMRNQRLSNIAAGLLGRKE